MIAFGNASTAPQRLTLAFPAGSPTVHVLTCVTVAAGDLARSETAATDSPVRSIRIQYP